MKLIGSFFTGPSTSGLALMRGAKVSMAWVASVMPVATGFPARSIRGVAEPDLMLRLTTPDATSAAGVTLTL